MAQFSPTPRRVTRPEPIVHLRRCSSHQQQGDLFSRQQLSCKQVVQATQQLSYLKFLHRRLTPFCPPQTFGLSGGGYISPNDMYLTMYIAQVTRSEFLVKSSHRWGMAQRWHPRCHTQQVMDAFAQANWECATLRSICQHGGACDNRAGVHGSRRSSGEKCFHACGIENVV